MLKSEQSRTAKKSIQIMEVEEWEHMGRV